MAPIVLCEDLEEFLAKSNDPSRGCFVDTNLLFAVDYDSHYWNNEAVAIAKTLARRKIPIYSNSVIKSGFLELKRRVLITESLGDYFEKSKSELPPNLFNKLKALSSKIRQEKKEDLHFFITGQKIKEFRASFLENLGGNSWMDFCTLYLRTMLKSEWEDQIAAKNVNYIDGQNNEFLTIPVEWERMLEIVEQHGIGISNAMIINFFLSSVFTFLITADADVAVCMEHIPTQKVCVVPLGLKY
jgi:hypothetical protein